MSLFVQYWASFALFGVLFLGLQYFVLQARAASKPAGGNPDISPQFSVFQRTFLIAFLLVIFSDWLQGPYLYQLYVWYGLSQTEIAHLFACGYGSSIVFSGVIGSLSDKSGRKRVCSLACWLSVAACLIIYWPSYWTLMIGRVVSGLASSILYCVFETYMASEHSRKGFDGSSVNDIFAGASFGSGIVAVLASLVANLTVRNFGYASPFGLAILPLALSVLVMYGSWDESESYGSVHSNYFATLSKGLAAARSDAAVAALGGSQACFEAALYLFLFLWTPALYTHQEMEAEKVSDTLPESTAHYLGLIMAVFVLAALAGSTFVRLVAGSKRTVYRVPLYLHLLALFSMVSAASCDSDRSLLYAAFLVFLVSVGLFYPSYGIIKAEKMPEESRSAVMNLFRIPLMGLVVVLLLHVTTLGTIVVLLVCAGLHAVSLVAYGYFYVTAGASLLSSADVKVAVGAEESISLLPKLETRWFDEDRRVLV